MGLWDTPYCYVCGGSSDGFYHVRVNLRTGAGLFCPTCFHKYLDNGRHVEYIAVRRIALALRRMFHGAH